MNLNMYKVFFEIQKKHWWFVVKKLIVLDLIAKYVRVDNPKILDVGCGSGLMLNSLDKIGNTCGIDMSDAAVAFSKEIFSGNIKQGYLPNNVSYADQTFDLITALDVIEHIDEDVASLTKIKKLLSRNGVAIITVPAYMFLWSGFDELNQHKRRYTQEELKFKLTKSGFLIEKITYYNSILFPLVFIVRMANKLMGRDGSSEVDMPNFFVNLFLKKIFNLERLILKYLNLPFGVSILAVARKI